MVKQVKQKHNKFKVGDKVITKHCKSYSENKEMYEAAENKEVGVIQGITGNDIRVKCPNFKGGGETYGWHYGAKDLIPYSPLPPSTTTKRKVGRPRKRGRPKGSKNKKKKTTTATPEQTKIKRIKTKGKAVKKKGLKNMPTIGRASKKPLKPYTGNSQIDFLNHNRHDLLKYMEQKGIYEAETIIKNLLLALKTKERAHGYGFAILSGCGGSGKTEIARHVLQYIKEKYHANTGYQIIANDENTSTDSLLARIDASSLSAENEKIIIGELGNALNKKENVLLDELNRTPFANVQKAYMTLFSLKEMHHRGINFNIPEGMIILATANLGSVGTFPLAQEFKQRAEMVNVQYTTPQIKKVMGQMYNGDGDKAFKTETALFLFKKTKQLAEQGRNGWNYEASVRTLKSFVEHLAHAELFGVQKKEAVFQALNGVIMQFTDESSQFIQRKNAEIYAEMESEILSIMQAYKK